MKNLAFIISICLCSFVWSVIGYKFGRSWNKLNPIIIHDTIRVKKIITVEPKYQLIVVKALVADYGGKDLVTRGSAVFVDAWAEKGYIIYVKKDDSVIKRVVCRQSDLTKFIDNIKYETKIDTLIFNK